MTGLCLFNFRIVLKKRKLGHLIGFENLHGPAKRNIITKLFGIHQVDFIS
jgi:hypothetical protein